jgi:hypothetical protein
MKEIKNSEEDEPGGEIYFPRAQRWYCPNCGQLAVGYPNSKNVTKVICCKCHIIMIKKPKGRHHDILELYDSVSAY